MLDVADVHLYSMTPLSLASSPSAASIVHKPYHLPSLRPIHTRYNQLKKLKQERRRFRDGKCRAEFATDAPVAMAIGTCILNSLIYPGKPLQEDVEAEAYIDTADARFAVMAVIGFIPYFNWMSWVFAWMDTGLKRRYAVYAVVYLAPYLRSNFSISPEESWLPIASILICIFHIQLEASVQNGDLQGFQLFNEAAKRLSTFTQKKSGNNFEEEGRKDFHDLPSAREQQRKDTRLWTPTQKPHQHDEISNKDKQDNEGTKH